MEVINLAEHLNKAGMDHKAGIRIIRATGDETCSLYVAEILPNTWLHAHYHQHGTEIYQIMEGKGVMRIGTREHTGTAWKEEYAVAAGDCFTVPEGGVHQLGNPTDQRLIACFICPPSHLGDDRFFMEEG